jgi:endonuclease/exonuclease/phosphatase family metal-dependent hydrolase
MTFNLNFNASKFLKPLILLAFVLFAFKLYAKSLDINSEYNLSSDERMQINKNSNLSITSYNIRNYDYDERSRIRTNKSKLASILLKLDADLIAVQEIRNTKDFSKFVTLNLPDYDLVLSRCGGSHQQKLGFIYKKSTLTVLDYFEDNRITKVKVTPGTQCQDGSRPAFISRFLINKTGKEFWSMTFHLKAGGRASSFRKRDYQFKIIEKIMNEFKEQKYTNFVLLGDLNTTEYNKKAKRYEQFNQFLKRNSLLNLTKDLECSSYWWGGLRDGIEYPSKLDHILISKDFVNVLHVKKATSYLSSHCSISKCQPSKPGKLGESFKRVSDHCPMTSVLR